MTPDNDRDYYKILEKEKRLRRGNAQPQAGAGSPQFSVVTPNERGQRPAAPQSPPATQSVQVGPPSRTISQRQAVLQQTPGAGPNSIGDAQKNIRVRHRALVTQAAAAYRAGDMDTYNALVSERNNLENQSRDLSAVQPKTFVNPENAQAARERLRVQLAQELASRQTTTPPRNDAAYEAGIQGAPASVRERMDNPVDEVNRQAMIRLKAREPMVTGTGMDMEVTTPEREEVRRRAAASMAPRRDPNQQAMEALPDVTDQERAAMNSRFADARGRQEGAVPGAVAALRSVQGEREFRESIKAKNRKLAETQLDTAIASGGAMGADEQVRLLDAQARLEQAKRRSDAARSVGTGSSAVRAAERLSGQLPGQLYKDTIPGKIAEYGKSGPAFFGTNLLYDVLFDGNVDQQNIDIAFRDIESSVTNLTMDERTQLSQQLRSLRDQLVGRPNAGPQIERIQKILSEIEPGR